MTNLQKFNNSIKEISLLFEKFEFSGYLLKVDFRYWIKLSARFLSFQTLNQVVSIAIGIVIVRSLSKTDYAYYVLTNMFIGIFTILSDSGISLGIMAIGNKIVEETDFNKLILAGSSIRRGFFLIVVIIVTPIFVWSFLNNHFEIYKCFIALAITLANVFLSIQNSVYNVVLRLKEQFINIQKIELKVNILRLLFLIGIYFTFAVNSLAALLVIIVGNFIQYQFYRIITKGLITFHAVIKDEVYSNFKNGIIHVIKRNCANAIFFTIQGQLNYFILTYFHNTTGIANIGALSRFTLIYLVVSAFCSTILVTKIVKSQDPKTILHLSLFTIFLFISISLLIVIFAFLFSSQILKILGPQYYGLEKELILLLFVYSLVQLSSIVSNIYLNKGWLPGFWWVYIPVAFVTQIWLVNTMTLQTMKEIIRFNMFSELPIVLFNFLLFSIGYVFYKQEYINLREHSS